MRRLFIPAAGVAVAFIAMALDPPSAHARQQDPPQTTSTVPQPTFVVEQPAFVNLSKVSNDYRVGPGDLLEIQVVAHTDLNQVLRISNSGEISFPMVGLVKVADFTAFEVEDLIATRLREKGLIQETDVLVFIREYQAKPIYVSGAVVNPGEFIMSQELTVVDAILLAGGLRFNAADHGLVQRRVSRQARRASAPENGQDPVAAEADTEIITVDLQPLKQGRFLENALPLQRGDVLFVPDLRMNAFYVVGDVLEPANYFYPVGRTLMASQAISSAGGPTPTAKMSDGMLVRFDAQGNRKEMKVDYDAILRGKQQDFPIQPDDVIFIPGSRVKTITHGLLMLSDQIVMQQVWRAGRRIQRSDFEGPARDDR